MPNQAITKPQPGDEVTAAWGSSVADSLNGIQGGVANVSIANAASGTMPITFPRPYVSPPVLVVSQASNSAGWVAYSGVPTTTGVTIGATTKLGTTSTSTIQVAWIAVGTLA